MTSNSKRLSSKILNKYENSIKNYFETGVGPTFITRTKRQTFGLKSSKLPYLSHSGLSSTCCY